MDLFHRLHDLGLKIDQRLNELRGRVTVLEQASASGPAITVGPVPPSSPSVNQLWVDTN